jgi:hypothetical protein
MGDAQFLHDEHCIISTHNRTTTTATIATTRIITILPINEASISNLYLPHMFVHCLVK